MTVIDNLRIIESLKNLRFRDNLSNTLGARLNYNEMTFIPFLRNHKANQVAEKIPSINDAINKVASFVKIIQETDLNSFKTDFQVNLYISSIAINVYENKNINKHTSLQNDINGAWLDFYCYGQGKDFKKDPNIVNKFEEQRELINQISKELDTKHNDLNRFLLFYYTLSEQLIVSLLHEEDRKYIIDSINKYAEKEFFLKEKIRT